MADGRYFTIVLTHGQYAADRITSKLNEMDREGWRFIQGWSVANEGSVSLSKYTTTLVFENERHEDVALEWTVQESNADDSILLDEMRAAERAQPAATDPLLDGLRRR